MARAQRSIRLAHSTHATREKITEGARWHFLGAMRRAVPDVLRELAEDEKLERLYDEASAPMIDERKNRPVGEPWFRGDLQGLPGARAELSDVLTAWGERYQLDDTWEWMLDAVLGTLRHWRRARLEGQAIPVSERTAWVGYYSPTPSTTTYKPFIGQAAFLPSFTHRFSGEALAALDEKALHAEALAAFEAAFQDFYSHLIHIQTEGDWQEVPTRHKPKYLEWLALRQFGDWRINQLMARYHKSEKALYAGLHKACSDLGVKPKQGVSGRPPKK